MKTIIELTHIEAREFFLKEVSYFNFDLPKYFKFQDLINKLSTKLNNKNLSDYYSSYVDTNKKTKTNYPSDFDDVNYKFLNNKDGKFAWRPFQLIHPALYVSLVHKITTETNWNFIVNRFAEFSVNHKIKCCSLPIKSETDLSDKATSVTNWWQSIEQQSIELALEYEYILHTDISDCYGSIYTHSVVWALHTKPIAKSQRRNKNLIGNVIDDHLQDMSFGQTNGIPQGSVLMDFIAEMVLGFADLELTERLNNLSISDYKIIRYRDDYRIFTNNPQKAELILKNITEILIELNMRLNSQKTIVSNNVVKSSIKPDKLFWNLAKRRTKYLQNHLLLIHDLAEKFPNSGSLSKSLTDYFNRIYKYEKIEDNINVLISILTDITYKNPRTYPISSAILSELLVFVTEIEREDLVNKILKKFELIPNTGHLQIWIQRITIKFDRNKNYTEKLCQKLNSQTVKIWNSDWLNNDLQNLINKEIIINEQIIDELKYVIEPDEVQLFDSKTNYNY